MVSTLRIFAVLCGSAVITHYSILTAERRELRRDTQRGFQIVILPA